MVVSTGLVWPSPGIHAAPTRSSVRTRGQRSASSSKSISRISTPTVRAMDRPRMISSQRSRSEATEMDPTARYPVAWPVSASRSSNSRAE